MPTADRTERSDRGRFGDSRKAFNLDDEAIGESWDESEFR